VHDDTFNPIDDLLGLLVARAAWGSMLVKIAEALRPLGLASSLLATLLLSTHGFLVGACLLLARIV